MTAADDLLLTLERDSLLHRINALLRHLHFPVENFRDIRQIQQNSCSMFVGLYEKIFQTRIDGMNRAPRTEREYRRNAETLLEAIGKQVRGVTAEELMQGGINAVDTMLHFFEAKCCEESHVERQLSFSGQRRQRKGERSNFEGKENENEENIMRMEYASSTVDPNTRAAKKQSEVSSTWQQKPSRFENSLRFDSMNTSANSQLPRRSRANVRNRRDVKYDAQLSPVPARAERAGANPEADRFLKEPSLLELEQLIVQQLRHEKYEERLKRVKQYLSMLQRSNFLKSHALKRRSLLDNLRQEILQKQQKLAISDMIAYRKDLKAKKQQEKRNEWLKLVAAETYLTDQIELFSEELSHTKLNQLEALRCLNKLLQLKEAVTSKKRGLDPDLPLSTIGRS